MFQPSSLSAAPLVARRNPSSGDLIARVSSYQVRNGSDMTGFLRAVEAAVEAERGSTLDTTTKSGLSALMTKAVKGSVKEIASIFGQVKSGAKDSGAPQTANAITNAAAWYYYNIEEPGAKKSSGSSSSGSSYTPTTSAADDSKPFYTKTWFLIAAPLTVTAALAALIWFWPTDAEVAAHTK
jgi:hypothetical protein